ncbi:hypothetical protein ACX0G7_05985 [Flavitalea antarctica]
MSRGDMNELKRLVSELQFNINSRFDAVDSRLDTISKDIESINKITMFREVPDNIDRFARQIVTH